MKEREVYYVFLSVPTSCFSTYIDWVFEKGSEEEKQLEFNTQHRLICTWILTKLFLCYCSCQTAPPPSFNKTTPLLSLTLSTPPHRTHTHTIPPCCPDDIQMCQASSSLWLVCECRCVSFAAIRLLYTNRWSITFYCSHLLWFSPLSSQKTPFF